MTESQASTGGASGCCPKCGATLGEHDGSHHFGGEHCPECKAPLWYIVLPTGPRFFLHQLGQSLEHDLADFIVRRVPEGVDRAELLLDIGQALDGDDERWQRILSWIERVGSTDSDTA